MIWEVDKQLMYAMIKCNAVLDTGKKCKLRKECLRYLHKEDGTQIVRFQHAPYFNNKCDFFTKGTHENSNN